MTRDTAVRKIVLTPSQTEFNCSNDEAILDAALREGIQLPYGCRGGSCGACKTRLIEGEIEYGDTEPEALTEKEMEEGYILCCQARAKTDLILKASEVTETKEISIKTLPSRVMKLEQLSHDVMGLWLKLPSTERLQFLAGQYIDILMKDGKERSFSLANAPHDDEYLQLQVRYYDGGVFSEIVFKEMKEKTLLRIKGPFGNFFLREDSNRPIIFVAGGTGFAPIKGIIEHMIAKGDQRPVLLYWGVRSKRDLYSDKLAREWAEKHDHIEYFPVLSDPLEDDNWKGKTGFVHNAILEDITDFSEMDVYASGPPIMVESIHKSFAQYGLQQERLFSDAFEFAATSKK
ncbi:MAG: CDP-6-deoxy-delta-3,4-glucoseen reductase [Gammaproteobacteria bacterium]